MFLSINYLFNKFKVVSVKNILSTYTNIYIIISGISQNKPNIGFYNSVTQFLSTICRFATINYC